MKILRLLFCLAIFAAAARLFGQVPDTGDNETAPPGATVIDSDELRMDQVGRTAIFTGNVIVNGSNFHLTCEEMTVFFTKDSKIDNIIAKGNVIIVQPGRITHCGQAQYFRDQDMFVLTDQPDILDNKNEIQAPKIIIFRSNQTLRTEGRTRTKVIEGTAGSNTNNAPAPTSN